VKVVTLLVTPQESERLSLATHSGTLRLAMRNYNDNKIVLTSGSDVAQMLRAYSLAPDVPVMAVQPETRRVSISTPHRAKPVEIEILRNGKSSESVSFVNEAAANFSGDSAPAHHKAAAQPAEDENDADADTAATATTVASAPDAEHHDLVTPPAAAAPIAAAPVAPRVSPDHVLTPKTIDIP
jgi:hypothetical protein